MAPIPHACVLLRLLFRLGVVSWQSALRGIARTMFWMAGAEADVLDMVLRLAIGDLQLLLPRDDGLRECL